VIPAKESPIRLLLPSATGSAPAHLLIPAVATSADAGSDRAYIRYHPVIPSRSHLHRSGRGHDSQALHGRNAAHRRCAFVSNFILSSVSSF